MLIIGYRAADRFGNRLRRLLPYNFRSREGTMTSVRAYRGRHEIVSVSVPAGEVKTIVGGDRQFGSFAVRGSFF
jgi:hypothetical protein